MYVMYSYLLNRWDLLLQDVLIILFLLQVISHGLLFEGQIESSEIGFVGGVACIRISFMLGDEQVFEVESFDLEEERSGLAGRI